MSKRKLLFVMAGMGRGGAERSLINLLEQLDPERYHIDLLVFDQRGELMGQLPPYVNVLRPCRAIRFLSCGDSRSLVRNFTFRGMVGRLRYMKKRNKAFTNYQNNQIKWQEAFRYAVPTMETQYDVAVAFMHSLPSYYVMDKAVAKKKYLWVHNDYSRLIAGREFDLPYFERADGVVTISEQCVRELEQAFPSLVGKFACIYNLNPEDKIRDKAEAFLPCEYEKIETPILLSIGRLNAQKGFDYAIDAAKMMKDRGLAFHWFIMGEGELREALYKQIERNHVEDCVTLLGGRENPYPYIKGATIVVQTSRFEGKSIVLDEAKILYKPILTTDYVSVRDQIEDGETGVIVPVSPGAIADGISDLLANQELMAHLTSRLQHAEDVTVRELKKYEKMFF